MRMFVHTKIQKYAKKNKKIGKTNSLLCAKKVMANTLHRINHYDLLLFINYGTSNY